MLEKVSSFFYLYISKSNTMTRAEYLKSLPNEEFIPFEHNGKYGFRNAKGEVLIPAVYDWIHRDTMWSGEYLEVSANNKWGYINKAGEVMLPIDYDEIFPVGIEIEGEIVLCYLLEKDGLSGIVDKDFNTLVPLIYTDLTAAGFNIHRAIARKDGKCGYIDIHNNTTIEFKFEECGLFQEELAPVKSEGKWGYIDMDGNIVIPCQFDEAYQFNEGFAAVMIDNKWGFIGKTGEVVIEVKYNDVECFSEGLAPVMVGEEWGYINKKGEMVVAPRFENAFTFHDNQAMVYGFDDDDDWGYHHINTQGEFID